EEANALDRRPQPLRGPRHERRVKRAGDAELHRPPGALELRAMAAFVDRRLLAGDDELARPVVVRRPDAEDPPADPLDDVVGETEDRRHGSRVLARRLR